MLAFYAIVILRCMLIGYSFKESASNRISCDNRLGMLTGVIGDDALFSSSQLGSSVDARFARPSSKEGWCPNEIANDDKLQESWLRVQFKRIMEVSKLEINILCKKKSSPASIAVRIDYYREQHNASVLHWKNYSYNGKPQVVRLVVGLNNVKLEPRIVARALRISGIPNGYCMQIELFGCSFTDDLIGYVYKNYPDIKDVHFDMTNSTERENNDCGLGTLTDGIMGTDNFRDHSGRDWVGWSKNSSIRHRRSMTSKLASKELKTSGAHLSKRDFVTLYFLFEHPRNFSYIIIHANNYFYDEIQLMHAVVVSFSSSDKSSFQDAITHYEPEDWDFEMARPVMVPLNHKVGSQVRIDLYFRSKWLLISEIMFESTSATDEPGQAPGGKISLRSSLPDFYWTKYDVDTIPANKGTSLSGVLLSLVVIFCCAMILLIFTVGVLITRNRHLTKNKNNYPNINHYLNSRRYSGQRYGKCCTGEITDEVDTFNDRFTERTETSGYVRPSLTRDLLLTSSSDNNIHTKLAFTSDRNRVAAFYDRFASQNCKNCCTSLRTCDRSMGRSSVDYGFTASHSTVQRQQCMHNGFMSIVPRSSVSAECENGSKQIMCDYQLEDIGRLYDHIDTKAIVRKEKQIGSSSDYELYSGSFYVQHERANPDVPSGQGNTVACLIKVMKCCQCPFAWATFQRDVQIMERCSTHPNFLKLMFASCIENPPHMVFEYEGVDLPQFLRDRSESLDISNLSYLGLQLCSALIHLQSAERCLHCDIAARNCIVNPSDFSLRVGNLAQLNSKYSNQYWWNNGPNNRLLPLRWLPPDFFHTRRFRSATNVWSIGVTLWEIYTLAINDLPYTGMTNKQVLELYWDIDAGESDVDILKIMGEGMLITSHIHGCRTPREIVSKCLRLDETTRPTIVQLKEDLSIMAKSGIVL